MTIKMTEVDEIFDALCRNFFRDTNFRTISQNASIGYPINVFQKSGGLYIQFAAVGAKKDEFEISIEGDVLHVKSNYGEREVDTDIKYLCHGITDKEFDYGWKISSKYNLDKIEADLVNGLLTIFIPIKPEEKPKMVNIK